MDLWIECGKIPQQYHGHLTKSWTRQVALEVQRWVLPKWGFDPTLRGAQEAETALAEACGAFFSARSLGWSESINSVERDCAVESGFSLKNGFHEIWNHKIQDPVLITSSCGGCGTWSALRVDWRPKPQPPNTDSCSCSACLTKWPGVGWLGLKWAQHHWRNKVWIQAWPSSTWQALKHPLI